MSEAKAASKAVRVTLFEDRAEVTRTARVSLAAGRAWAALAGETPCVDERSVQARLAGGGEAAAGARVIVASVRWIVHMEKALGRDQIEAYAERKGWSVAEAEKWLSPNLGYDPDD